MTGRNVWKGGAALVCRTIRPHQLWHKGLTAPQSRGQRWILPALPSLERVGERHHWIRGRLSIGAAAVCVARRFRNRLRKDGAKRDFSKVMSRELAGGPLLTRAPPVRGRD